MEKFRNTLGFYSCTVPSFEQYTLARFLSRGHFEKHINRMRKFYRARRNRVIGMLQSCAFAHRLTILEQDAGLHFLLKVDTALSDSTLTEKLLEAGGWVYDEYGDPWEGDGLRYKKVTYSEAEYMDECDDWGDTYMMPLVIKWAASEDNMVTDLLKVLLAQSEDVENLGMEIQVDEMSFADMLSHMYRQDIYSTGNEEFEEPYYSVFNLASGWDSAQYDASGLWAGENQTGYDSCYLYDTTLDQLAETMVYGVAEGDRAGYLKAWQDYIIRHNQLVPEIALYVDCYATVYSADVLGYDQDTFWGFQNAVLYASIAE